MEWIVRETHYVLLLEQPTPRSGTKSLERSYRKEVPGKDSIMTSSLSVKEEAMKRSILPGQLLHSSFQPGGLASTIATHGSVLLHKAPLCKHLDPGLAHFSSSRRQTLLGKERPVAARP